MKGEHPLFKAWESCHVQELPGNTPPVRVARMLLNEGILTGGALNFELRHACIREVVANEKKLYPEDLVISFMELLGEALAEGAMD